MFDPYHKWLGIPPGKRPPTYYQLLAVAEGEKDREVIEAATVRQSAYVRNFQKGPNADLAARLLAEIAEAREVLADPARRKTYDDKLEAEKPKPAVAKPVAAVAVQPVTAKAAPVQPRLPARSGKRRKSATLSLPLIIGALGVVATASGLGVYLATRTRPTSELASSQIKDRKDRADRSAPNPTPANDSAQPNEQKPFGWDQGKVDRPYSGVNPGPPPGFGQSPPGFARPEVGRPGGPVPPPGLFKPQGGKSQMANDANVGGAKNQGDVKDADPPKKTPKKPLAEGIDGALEQLDGGNIFDYDKAAKTLIGSKVEPARKAEVAKALNLILIEDKHLSDNLWEAAGVWGDDDTVKIIADKLAARPWVDRGAIKAAGRIKHPRLVLPVRILLENFFNWEDATRALQQMGPVAEDHVRQLLQHRDPKMRVQVCIILSSIGTEKSLPALRRASGEKQTSLAAKAAIQEINERVKSKQEETPVEADAKP